MVCEYSHDEARRFMMERDAARTEIERLKERVVQLEGHLDWLGWSSDAELEHTLAERCEWFCRQALPNLEACNPDTVDLEQARLMLRVMKSHLATMLKIDDDKPVG